MAEEDESGPLTTTTTTTTTAAMTTTTTTTTVAMATTTTTTMTTTMGADDVVASTRSVETIEGVAVVGEGDADAEGDALVRQYQRSVDDQTLDPDLVAALVEYILYSSYDKGAILVFVSGWHDIERCQDKLEESSVAHSLWVVPLHGSIESSKQRDAFRPPANEKQWKVVLATNVAETSVTIPDVSFVIDLYCDHGYLVFAREFHATHPDALVVPMYRVPSEDQQSSLFI